MNNPQYHQYIPHPALGLYDMFLMLSLFQQNQKLFIIASGKIKN